MTQVTVESLAALFGTTAAKVEAAAGDVVRSLDMRVAPLDGDARDAVLLDVLRRIHLPELPAAGGHRAPDWESGWRQNLDEFVASGYDKKTLVPKYVKPSVRIRLNRQYVQPALHDFVYHYTEIFRAWLFREYLAPFASVHEFGCGTGHNLVHLAELYPDKTLVGLDWATSSQEIVTLIAKHLGVRITGRRFDFFHPDTTITMGRDVGVLTFGALEQVGVDHAAFIQCLLERKPGICVDVVGLEELYDDSHLLDYLGLLYHRRRRYLSGYLTALRALQDTGAVEIIKVHHQSFGNLYDDPYSYVVWRVR